VTSGQHCDLGATHLGYNYWLREARGGELLDLSTRLYFAA